MENLHVYDSSVQIDGIIIPTKKTEITLLNTLEVEVGTTGPRGGDTGHGGRTFLRLRDLSSTDLRARIDGGHPFWGRWKDESSGDWYSMMSSGSVEIAFGGDCELYTFIDALKFAVETLEEQCSMR